MAREAPDWLGLLRTQTEAFAGFISNAEEERLLTSDEYQQRVVSALVRGLSRYQQQREQRRGTFSTAGSPSGSRP